MAAYFKNGKVDKLQNRHIPLSRGTGNVTQLI